MQQRFPKGPRTVSALSAVAAFCLFEASIGEIGRLGAGLVAEAAALNTLLLAIGSQSNSNVRLSLLVRSRPMLPSVEGAININIGNIMATVSARSGRTSRASLCSSTGRRRLARSDPAISRRVWRTMPRVGQIRESNPNCPTTRGAFNSITLCKW